MLQSLRLAAYGEIAVMSDAEDIPPSSAIEKHSIDI